MSTLSTVQAFAIIVCAMVIGELFSGFVRRWHAKHIKLAAPVINIMVNGVQDAESLRASLSSSIAEALEDAGLRIR